MARMVAAGTGTAGYHPERASLAVVDRLVRIQAITHRCLLRCRMLNVWADVTPPMN
jgi:hypothetical protein